MALDDGLDALMVSFHVTESNLQMVFEGVDAIENPVMERLFAQVIPEVLDRIEFRRILRLFE